MGPFARRNELRAVVNSSRTARSYLIEAWPGETCAKIAFKILTCKKGERENGKSGGSIT